MHVATTVQDLLLAAAPLADLLVMDFYEDKKTWHIAADRETEIFGELDERRNVLVLSQPLGTAPLTKDLLSLALQFNHVWDGNGGMRVTLAGEAGFFWLVMDIGLGKIEPERLSAAIKDFTAKGAAWRDILQTPFDGDADSLGVLASAGMMRV